jgi:UDP-N-acetylmuramoyl-tripeptide--D-alanyl-D-alanine ligase
MPTLKDLQEAVAGRLLPPSLAKRAAEMPLGQICCDSRQVRAGEVYWSLLEAANDGAAVKGACLVHEAFRHGAQGVVLTDTRIRETWITATSLADVAKAHLAELPKNCWALLVDDPREALTLWARWHRQRMTCTVVAVAGHEGINATRHLIGAVLQNRLKTHVPASVGRGQRAAGSARMQDSAYCLPPTAYLPLAVLSIEPDHDCAVIELNAARADEMSKQLETCLPKVAVMMPLAQTQLNTFGSRLELFEMQSRLLAGLPDEGLAVLADDTWLQALAASSASRIKAPITWIGMGSECDLRATIVTQGRGKLSFQVASNRHEPVTFTMGSWGRSNIEAALAAIAVGRGLGMDWKDIASALAHYEPLKSRFEVEEIGGVMVINEAVQSQSRSRKSSMQSTLAMLGAVDTHGRRVVVCGDLCEAGPKSVALHWQLGREIATLGRADLLIACGASARHVTAGARSTGLFRSHAVPCDTIEDAMQVVIQAVLPGDLVLVKSSPVMDMNWIVDRYRALSPQNCEKQCEAASRGRRRSA